MRLNLSLPVELIERLESTVKKRGFNSRTEAIREYLELALKIDVNRDKLQDPEFISSLDDFWHEDKILTWVDTMSPRVQKILAQVLEIKRDNKELDFKCT